MSGASEPRSQLPAVVSDRAYVSYTTTAIRNLRAGEESAPFSNVLPDGSRAADKGRLSCIFQVQTYVMRNNPSFYDAGESTVYAPPARFDPTGADFWKQSTPVLETKIKRDGSILGYIIQEAETKRTLLKIHFHGDTSNPFSRTFKAFVRSPVLKWDVENWGLFENLQNGVMLGMIREVFPDNRVFEPTQAVQGLPRLEMQYTSGLGLAYLLAVTDVQQPIGEVSSSLIARFAPRSEAYQMTLRNCTREEAVLWLTMVVATDMKRRKSQNARYGSSFASVFI